MARVPLTAYEFPGEYRVASISGLNGTQGTSAGWTLYAQGGRTGLNIWNADVSPHTIVVKNQDTGLTYLQDSTETIPATKNITIAGFPANQVNSAGKVEIDLEVSAEANLYGKPFTFNPTKS